MENDVIHDVTCSRALPLAAVGLSLGGERISDKLWQKSGGRSGPGG